MYNVLEKCEQEKNGFLFSFSFSLSKWKKKTREQDSKQQLQQQKKKISRNNSFVPSGARSMIRKPKTRFLRIVTTDTIVLRALERSE